MAINHKLYKEEIELVDYIYDKTEKKMLTVFDVGTNRGLYIDMFLNKPIESSIHSFEPIQSLYDDLEKKYGNNKNIFLNRSCVSDKMGEVTFHELLNPETDGCSSIIERPVFKQRNWPYKSYTVSSLTIDEYCKNNNVKNIDFLKVDVEGAEFSVILGCKNILKKGLVEIIQFEYGVTFDDANVKLLDVFNLVNSYGYGMFTYENKVFSKITLENINTYTQIDNCNYIIKKLN